MSVLVKGMKMPKNCEKCLYLSWSNFYQIYVCNAIRHDEPVLFDKKQVKSTATVRSGRADNCPLVPVQPHGRMIDADALASDLTRFYEGEVTARKLIAEQPTIDAVPVVRCRDCKWHNELGSRDGKGYCQRPSYASGLHGYCHGKDTPPDWYCADAERKEGEGWHG